MCENLKYWMKLRSSKIGLIVIVASFLFFKSTGKSPALADSDHDGLIEIKNATMLHNMRYNLTGTSYKKSARDAGDSSGCPRNRCNGYELSTDIDLLKLLDKNKNGRIDTTTVGIDKNADDDTKDAGEKVSVIDTTADTSWVPVGNAQSGAFSGTFEGNNHTIANLWVNIASLGKNDAYAGLFGMTGERVTIRNVGVISGSIHASSASSASSSDSSYSGGLVGQAWGNATITNSYFSGSGGVSSSSTGKYSFSGGLVGEASDGSVTITNSYFSGVGGVSSSSTGKYSSSGGLVSGGSTVTITKCYFSGGGGVSSSSTFSSSSGGLVGYGTVTITNSYFSGSGGVSSSSGSTSFSGGLVGFSDFGTVSITNSYFSGLGGVSSSSGSSSRSGGLVGKSNSLTITNSYFSGMGGVSSSSFSDSSSGGLVGGGTVVTIINSYFSGSGGVSSKSSKTSRPSYSYSFSGGLVGSSYFSATITNSYFSGSGDVSSSSSSGGLVGHGRHILTITNSYFSGGGVFSSSSSAASGSSSGGLVGEGATASITNSYWNTDAPQSVKGTSQNPKRARGDSAKNPAGAKGLTLVQLKAARGTYPSGLPNGTGSSKAWNLGTRRQLPAIKMCVKPTVKKKVVTCASYGSLLPGQR